MAMAVSPLWRTLQQANQDVAANFLTAAGGNIRIVLQALEWSDDLGEQTAMARFLGVMVRWVSSLQPAHSASGPEIASHKAPNSSASLPDLTAQVIKQWEALKALHQYHAVSRINALTIKAQREVSRLNLGGFDQSLAQLLRLSERLAQLGLGAEARAVASRLQEIEALRPPRADAGVAPPAPVDDVFPSDWPLPDSLEALARSLVIRTVVMQLAMRSMTSQVSIDDMVRYLHEEHNVPRASAQQLTQTIDALRTFVSSCGARRGSILAVRISQVNGLRKVRSSTITLSKSRP